MRSAPVRFVFEDFGAAPVAARAEPDAGVDALAAARDQGFSEGRAAAVEAARAMHEARLDDLAAAIAREAETRRDALAADRADMLAAARAFLETFCARLATQREIEAASELLGRLTAFTAKSGRVRLLVADGFAEESRAAIEARLQRAGDAPPVAIAVDPALQPGEARLEWSDGALRRTRAEIDAAVTRLVDSLDHHLKEAQS